MDMSATVGTGQSSNTFTRVFGHQCEIMQAAVQSLDTLNEQITYFIASKSVAVDTQRDALLPEEQDTLKKSLALMRQLLMDVQGKILTTMEDNKQLAAKIDVAVQSASREVTSLRAELTATSRRLAELSPGADCAGMDTKHGEDDCDVRSDELQHHVTVLLREEVSRLQEEVQWLRQMKEMLTKELEDSNAGKSAEILSVTELKVQLAQKETELARAKEALQAMKTDRKRLKAEKADLVNQMQQLYATLESREEQLRDFIRNYEQHRKESEDAVKVLGKEKDSLEREKWDLRRQAKEATDHVTALRTQLDLKENRIKELEAELAMIMNRMGQKMEYRIFDRSAEKESFPRVLAAKQSLATLTKDVPKRHSLAMPSESMLNGNQEWVTQSDLPLTAAIRQSQQTLYHAHHHSVDRQGVRVSPCHSRQPSTVSDASVLEGERSSTPSDINSPRHRTHSLCNSLEDLEEQKRKKKKEKMVFGSISRVFARGKQRKSLDPGLFDDSDSLSSPTHLSLSLSEGDEHLDRLQQVEIARTMPMSQWKAGTVQAWLEVVMAMPMYIKSCTENVKSGRVLLSLNDEDLEKGLGVNSSMHRRKLRLAIEDYREAECGKGLSKASELDHHWVAKAWLNDVGLLQYSQAFHNHLIDGRMLNSLTKRDLERYLNVSKKFHQISLLLGIELFRQWDFDREILHERRAWCENHNVDPLVWTNQRVIKWVREIDLKEYADNLLNSGVHGAVLVLEPTFNSEAMATALGIPSNKHIIRRHLFEELNLIVNPARHGLLQESQRLGQLCYVQQGSLGHYHTGESVLGYAEDETSRKYRTGRGPMDSVKAFGGKDLCFREGYSSHPQGASEDELPRTARCSLQTFTGIEVTNV
ncbi:kazrin-like isoform X1 [Pristis pectinata]|uniref:kazrin-like isoform X1 n=3 Tax=Pristis pectinata TaxID=685728 RepID=UPI00223D2862|nr:kazrin-like isoform X1 [Pristis pectinata]